MKPAPLLSILWNEAYGSNARFFPIDYLSCSIDSSAYPVNISIYANFLMVTTEAPDVFYEDYILINLQFNFKN